MAKLPPELEELLARTKEPFAEGERITARILELAERDLDPACTEQERDAIRKERAELRLRSQEASRRYLEAWDAVIAATDEEVARQRASMPRELSIIFHTPPALLARTVTTFDESTDDFVSVLTSICAELHAAPGVRLEIRGFGEEPWPASVATDLPIALAQLPNLAARLARGEAGELDLHEPGLQRRLLFQPNGDLVRITCESVTTWQPNPALIEVSVVGVVAMLEAVVHHFAFVVRRVFPSVAGRPWLAEWRLPLRNPT